MWNWHKIPELYPLFSWGAGLGVKTGAAPLHSTSASCLCHPQPQGSPTLQQWQQQAKTMWGTGCRAAPWGADPGLSETGGGQGQPPSQGLGGRQGSSGATQAIGTKASASKGGRTSPLGESEDGLGSPPGWWRVGQGLLSPARNPKVWGATPAECRLPSGSSQRCIVSFSCHTL